MLMAKFIMLWIYLKQSSQTNLISHCFANKPRGVNEAALARFLPMLWLVQQSGAAVKPKVVVLTSLNGHLTSILFLKVFPP